MKRSVIFILITVLVILVGGGFFFWSSSKTLSEDIPTISQISPLPKASSSAAEESNAAVTITDKSYSPQEIKIKRGESVTWVNTGAEEHTVNSDPHPQHTVNPFINEVGLLKPGQRKSLAFPNKGTFKYHDHLNASLRGTVIVE